jgi:hypothetical protein
VNSGFAVDVQNILGVPVLTNIQFAGNGTRRREKQEIKRIDSAAPDFDELFLQGERLAQQRAFLLNGALSG